MKKVFYVIFTMLSTTVGWGQEVSSLWFNSAGGTDDDCGLAITSDVEGNVISTGYFNGVVDFDPGSGVLNKTSEGDNDVYIQKLDDAGNLLWVVTFGSTADDEGRSMDTDEFGNIYVAGTFEGTTDFDPGTGSYIESSEGDKDIFLLKLNSDGEFVWVITQGDEFTDYAHDVFYHETEGLLLTGQFEGTVDLDPGAGFLNYTAGGGANIFVQKLDSDGNLVWAKSMGGTSNNWGFTGEIDDSGNVIIAGCFQGTTDFDTGSGTYAVSSAGGSIDVFIEKLSSSGDMLWVGVIGGTGYEKTPAIRVTSSGDIYMTGYFNGVVDFDPTAGEYELTSSGDDDLFLEKIDTDGNMVWLRTTGGTDEEFSNSIELDEEENIYTTGFFNGVVDFDPGPDVLNLTSGGGTNAYLNCFNSSGDLLWAHSLDGDDDNSGHGIAASGLCKVYLTGRFSGTADFDIGAEVEVLTSSSGSSDQFVLNIGNVVSAGMDSLVSFCSEDTVINVSEYLAGAEAAGTWVDFSASGSFDPISTDFDLTGLSAGDYLFAHIVDSINCSKDTAYITVKVKVQSNAGFDSSISVCNTEELINLNDYLSGAEAAGVWEELSSSESFDPVSADFSVLGLSTGDYLFAHIIDDSINCVPDTAYIAVEVKEQLSAGLDSAITICNSEELINLNDYLSGEEAIDVWEELSTSGSFDPASADFNTLGISSGDYTFLHLVDLVDCPTDTAYIEIEVKEQLTAGPDSTVAVCNNIADFDVSSLLTDADSGGSWSEITSSGSFDSATATFDCFGLASGTYDFLYSIDSESPCIADEAEFSIELVPFSFAGNDTVIYTCNTEGVVDLFSFLAGEFDFGGTWQDTDATGALSGSALDLSVPLSPGTYNFIYVHYNEMPCDEDAATVTVSIQDCLSISDLTSLGVKVYPNPAEEIVFIDDPEKVVSRVEMFSMTGEMVNSSDDLKLQVSQLESGSYVLRIYTSTGGVFFQKVIKQ